MKSFALVVFALLSFFPAFAEDRADPRRNDRIKLKFDFISSDIGKRSSDPNDFLGERGENFRGKGVNGEATLAVSQKVSVGFNARSNFLTGGFYLAEGTQYPTVVKNSRIATHEVFTSFAPSWTAGHRLNAGFTHIGLDRTFAYEPGVTDRLTNRYLGFFFRAEGKKDLRRLEINYGAKFFPYLHRRETYAFGQPGRVSYSQTNRYNSTGWELDGGAIYWFSRRVGLEYNYLFRRLGLGIPNLQSSDTERGSRVGLVFSF